jgi:predicted phage tail protein
MQAKKLALVVFGSLALIAGPGLAQDLASKLNAPRVNLVSNVSNWQNTLQFSRLMRTSSFFRSLISADTRSTVFAVENDTLGQTFPIEEIDRIVGRRDVRLADRVVGAHVLRGIITAATLSARIDAGEGVATLVTVSGVRLTATKQNGVISLASPNGSVVRVTSADHRSRNGIVHVVSGVMGQ